MTTKPCTCEPLPNGEPSYDDPTCPQHALEASETKATEVRLEAAKKALLPKDGKAVSLSDITALLAKPAPAAPVPTKPALPAEILEVEKTALELLPKVFGQVVPAEVRALEPAEVSGVLSERTVLNVIAKMATNRLDGIRTTMLNHGDEVLRETVDEEVLGRAKRTKDGHIIPSNLVDREGNVIDGLSIKGLSSDDTEFAITPVKGSVGFSKEALEAIAKDEDDDRLDWKTYLKMTTQTRVFDQEKAIIELRKDPELLSVIAECTTTGQPTVQVRQPKAKSK